MLKLHFEDYDDYGNVMHLFGENEEQTIAVTLSVNLDHLGYFASTQEIDDYVRETVSNLFGDNAIVTSMNNPYVEE